MTILKGVYRFKDLHGNIIYIGKSQNIVSRINQHFSKGHLVDECYSSVRCIEYAEIESLSDIEVYEPYLINKYKPKYNISLLKDDVVNVSLPELTWVNYITRKSQSREIKSYSKRIQELSHELISIKNENSALKNELKETLRKPDYICDEDGVNNETITYSLDEIIEILDYSKSDILSFSATVVANGCKVVGSSTVYYLNNKIHVRSDLNMVKEVVLYDCKTQHKDMVLDYVLYVGMIPNYSSLAMQLYIQALAYKKQKLFEIANMPALKTYEIIKSKNDSIWRTEDDTIQILKLNKKIHIYYDKNGGETKTDINMKTNDFLSLYSDKLWVSSESDRAKDKIESLSKTMEQRILAA